MTVNLTITNILFTWKRKIVRVLSLLLFVADMKQYRLTCRKKKIVTFFFFSSTAKVLRSTQVYDRINSLTIPYQCILNNETFDLVLMQYSFKYFQASLRGSFVPVKLSNITYYTLCVIPDSALR